MPELAGRQINIDNRLMRPRERVRAGWQEVSKLPLARSDGTGARRAHLIGDVDSSSTIIIADWSPLPPVTSRLGPWPDKTTRKRRQLGAELNERFAAR